MRILRQLKNVAQTPEHAFTADERGPTKSHLVQSLEVDDKRSFSAVDFEVTENLGDSYERI